MVFLKKSQLIVSGRTIDVSYINSGEGLWIHCVSGDDFLGSWFCKSKDDIFAFRWRRQHYKGLHAWKNYQCLG